jgi:hypothetical protein
MQDAIRAFREQILCALDELERDLARTRADWEQKKGVFHDEGYVYRENLLVFDEELAAVQRTRRFLMGMDAEGFTKISEYHARVIEELEKAASASVLLRSGFAIIVKLVRGMSEDPSLRPFCT